MHTSLPEVTMEKLKMHFMPLSIEDPHVERLARDLAASRGLSVAEVVRQALEAWQRQGLPAAEDDAPDLEATLLRIAAEYRTLPKLDSRSDDEILGYDETGLPQ